MRRLPYDWRDEHIDSWDDEVAALKENGIELTAFWAPVSTEAPMQERHWPLIWELIDRNRLTMQLWVSIDEKLFADLDQHSKVERAVVRLVPLASEAARRDCRIGLYNHGGWFGNPEHLVEIVEALRDQNIQNVGIVFNFHHAHEYVDGFPQHAQRMKDFLMCVNLNGMRGGGPKILPIGSGDREREMIDALQRAGYCGPYGILDHREELDARASLQQNLDGLQNLRAR
jgi:sugar phosphate isomerase/epimerase